MNIRNYKKTSKSDRSGTAAVEAALLLPMLAIIMLGSIDIAQYINLAQMVAQSSREGARIASRNATTSVNDVNTAILDYFEDAYPQLTSSVISNAVQIEVLDKNGTAISNGDLTTIVSGDSMSIRIQFDYDAVRWMNGLDYWEGASETVTHCRRE